MLKQIIKKVLYTNEANYSNSESYLSISGDVKIKDIRGEIFTDNLFFDLKTDSRYKII